MASSTPNYITKAAPVQQLSPYAPSVQPFLANSIQQQHQQIYQQPVYQQQPVFMQPEHQIQQPVHAQQHQPVFLPPVQQGQPQFIPPQQQQQTFSMQTPPPQVFTPPIGTPPPQQQIQAPQPIYSAQVAPPLIVNQQPAAKGTMTFPGVGGGNLNAKNLPMSENGRDWSVGLFDCCDDAGTCMLAWCFPSITYGRNKQRLDHLINKGYPDPEQGGWLNSDCFLHGLAQCCGFGCLLQLALRGTIRSRYRIQGDGCGDFWTVCCCTPCELTQESREIDLEERSFY